MYRDRKRQSIDNKNGKGDRGMTANVGATQWLWMYKQMRKAENTTTTEASQCNEHVMNQMIEQTQDNVRKIRSGVRTENTSQHCMRM